MQSCRECLKEPNCIRNPSDCPELKGKGNAKSCFVDAILNTDPDNPEQLKRATQTIDDFMKNREQERKEAFMKGLIRGIKENVK